MGESTSRLQALDLLRFPLAVAIVAEHTFMPSGIRILGEASGWGDYPFFAELCRWFDALVRGNSVPIFFFISGYVFFLRAEMTRATYLRKFKSRIRTLLVPYLVWNTLAVLLLLFTLHSPFSRYLAQESRFTPSWPGFLSCYWAYDGSLAGIEAEGLYPLDISLWFLRDLMVVVLSTPLLYFVLKRARHYAVLALGILWLLEPFYASCFAVNRLGFLTAFFFFSWGACLSVCRKDVLEEFGRFSKLSVAGYFLLGAACVLAGQDAPDAEALLKKLNILAGLLFACNASSWLVGRGFCKASTAVRSLPPGDRRGGAGRPFVVHGLGDGCFVGRFLSVAAACSLLAGAAGRQEMTSRGRKNSPCCAMIWQNLFVSLRHDRVKKDRYDKRFV